MDKTAGSTDVASCLITEEGSIFNLSGTYPEIGDGNFNITHSHFID